MTRRERLTIGGMSCATCSETVSESAKGLEGVEEVTVNFATDEGTVAFDPEAVSLADIYEAIESADVTLMRSDPADVLKALRISEATMSKVWQNLFWAFAYNTALIPIASLGLLNPALGGRRCRPPASP